MKITKAKYNWLVAQYNYRKNKEQLIEISDEEYQRLTGEIIPQGPNGNTEPMNPEQENSSIITYTALSKLIENNDNDYKEGYLNMCDFDAPIKSHKFENNIGIIEFYGKLTKIGSNAFWDCDNLISINIPNTILTIRSGAFHGCNLLSSVVLSNNLKNIERGVFGLCNSLSNIIIPNSVTRIGFDAFSGCESLTEINIPNSVTSINDMVFHYCTSLTNVILPNTIYSINTAAFASCINLQNINIPESIIHIDNDAFKSCIKLSNECKEKILAINPNCSFSIQ